jgi:energy-coupling factor transport system substrate-specific component
MDRTELSGDRVPSVGRGTSRGLALVITGISFNLALGTLVHALRLPVYLDAVGTIIVTLVGGLRAGVITGVSSFLIGGIVTNPVLPWFSGTQAVIALLAFVLARLGWFRSGVRVIAAGITIGIAAAIVSAPVIAALFGGITGSGVSIVTSFLIASGRNVLHSVLLSGLAAEPIDKTLQCLLAVWVIRGLPRSVLERFSNEALRASQLA